MDVKELLGRIGIVDGVALVLLLSFFLRGLVKGFVWQLAGLLAVVGGLAAGNALATEVAPSLRRVFPALTEENNLDLIAAYFAVFLLVSLGVFLVAKLLRSVIEDLELGSFDRALGGVFGVVKAAALIVTAVFFVFLLDFPRAQERIASARTGQWAGEAIERGGVLFPEPLQEKIRQAFPEAGVEQPGEEGVPPAARERKARPAETQEGERRAGAGRRNEDQRSGDQSTEDRH